MGLKSKARNLVHVRVLLKLQLVLLNFDGVKKKHVQGTGASTSLKSVLFLLYVYCGEADLLLAI